MKNNKKIKNILDKIKEHVYENINLYIIVSIFFIIGIIIGVFFLNKNNIEIQESISNYISTSIENLKNGYEINHENLLKQILFKNIIYAFFIWFMGCTVIGMPIVYALITWKGFSLSYTISSIILSMGAKEGTIFCLLSLFLQNIITIPAIFAIAVSGNKLYKSIIKDKRRENIKISIIRHTILSISMIVLLIISSLIEVYISSNLANIYITQFHNN